MEMGIWRIVLLMLLTVSLTQYIVHKANSSLIPHTGLPPPPPHSKTVSYTDTVAIIAWQPPSVTVPYSQCVSSYTIDSTIIVTSTTVDTSVSVSLVGLSPGVYTVKVASVIVC